ncbi:MAG: ATP-dependent DNA helicase UvrD2 [archaeon]
MSEMCGSKELDYLLVLKAIDEIPFGVGRKLLIDFLQGSEKNDSIERNRLKFKASFGSMAYDTDELGEMIDSLLLNDMIRMVSVNGNRFFKVMELTAKGKNEIVNPHLYKKKLSFNFRKTETTITDLDRKMFEAFDDFLGIYNDEQKKAIISNKRHVLCIAGAGSGKTTVLTKRIEFIVKYRSANPGKILAITFTRKARQEMTKRLALAGYLDSVAVETFNSFCEKILRLYNDVAYDKPVRVIGYRDKIIMVNKALSRLDMNMNAAISVYFSDAQRRGKMDEQLSNIFINDCFFIRDYFKFKNKAIDISDFDAADREHEESAKLVFAVCNYIDAHMRKYGLRDFADQIIDTISLFLKHKEFVPCFDYVLVDEFQDVNSGQVKIIEMLNPVNLFCVGDPRQSIYGWRGSDIRYILNFEDKYHDCDIITLTKNYRSTKHIVELINSSIRKMGLADLESALAGDKDVKLMSFDSEGDEAEFVMKSILATGVARNEIFVLARTNRQLNELSDKMKKRGIRHIVRSDEMRRSVASGADDVTLATIHAIKGLEAEMVFVVGCSGANFPCKGSEHPVVEMVKVDEYDKEEEERRLFYVAMSRAKRSLYLLYSGKRPTYFITDEMLGMMDEKKVQTKQKKGKTVKARTDVMRPGDVVTRLKKWRREVSNAVGVPAFMIMHDRTLAEIAEKIPQTISDLRDIHGLGPLKIGKYGKDILGVVNE